MTDTTFPAPPSMGQEMAATNASQTARDFLAKRRSISKTCLSEPGPTGDELIQLLNVATRVPDHRRLSPWRFIVLEGEARTRFGETLARVQSEEDPNVSEAAIADTKRLPLRAPTIIVVISSPDVTHKTPVWEQELSTGAVCYNLLLAANASGWAGCWLTEWMSYSDGVNSALNLTEHERIAGFIYLGTATHPPQERLRPDTSSLITHWE